MENSFYQAPGGTWAQETCAGAPQQRYATGEPGKVQGRVPRGKYLGEIRFIEKPGVQGEGGRHVGKRSSDPQVAYPEVKVQVRDLV